MKITKRLRKILVYALATVFIALLIWCIFDDVKGPLSFNLFFSLLSAVCGYAAAYGINYHLIDKRGDV